MLAGALFGAEAIPFSSLFSKTSVSYDIVFSIRLPRTLSAYTTGALLAFSGCLMQVLFQNPLADSYLLGTSSGASLGMLLAVLLGIDSLFFPFSAAIGACLAIMITLMASHLFLLRKPHDTYAPSLLLTGVMITAIINAIMLLLLTLLPDYALKGTLFWIIGDLTYPEYWPLSSAFVIICLLLGVLFGKIWNIYAYGSLQAKSLGVSTVPVSVLTVLGVGIASGVSVAIAGPIGFIGLVAPHIGRKLIGNDLRILLPVSMLLGGSLLVFADLVARTIAPPLQPPVGIFTMLIGAPCFLWLLFRRQA